MTSELIDYLRREIRGMHGLYERVTVGPRRRAGQPRPGGRTPEPRVLPLALRAHRRQRHPVRHPAQADGLDRRRLAGEVRARREVAGHGLHRRRGARLPHQRHRRLPHVHGRRVPARRRSTSQACHRERATRKITVKPLGEMSIMTGDLRPLHDARLPPPWRDRVREGPRRAKGGATI